MKSLIPESQILNPSFPMKSKNLLKYYRAFLATSEISELANYTQIYYFSFDSARETVDDEHGRLRLGSKDHIAYRYEVTGQVSECEYRCFDHKRKEEVLIKVSKNRKKHYQQAYTEIKLLETLKTHKNIVAMKNFFEFRLHACIVYEIFAIELNEYLLIHSLYKVGMTELKKIGLQILTGLQYIKKHRIIHCDICPSNLMIENSSNVKIAHFGVACFLKERVRNVVQNLKYRAPEVVLGFPYTMAIDMWSFGCILFELATGYSLFTVNDEQELIDRIVQVVGLPPENVTAQSTQKHIMFTGDRRYDLNRMVQGKSLADLIERCLDWDPVTRINPTEALVHSFFWETDLDFDSPNKLLSNEKTNRKLNPN